MYNIFQRIALERAIGTAILFSYSYSTFDYAVKYYLGDEKNHPKLYYLGKYSLLGQKIATACVPKLQQLDLIPALLDLNFLSESIILPEEEPNNSGISATSEPELGHGLKGTDRLMEQLFQAAGWKITDMWIDLEFCDYDFGCDIDPNESESFYAWFLEVYSMLDPDSSYFLWKFHSKDAYSFDELVNIFEDMVRYCQCHYSFLPDGSISVYVFGQEEEEYDKIIVDSVNYSSINVLSPILALYYAGHLNPSFLLEDFSLRTKGGGTHAP